MALLTQPIRRLRRGRGACWRGCAAVAWASHQLHGHLGHGLLILGIALCAVLWSWRAAPANMLVAREYQVKAIFLYNFAQFITWPATAFPDAHTPITIGILGDDPFGSYLEKAVQGEVIDGRSLTIKRFKRVEEAIDSHMLFVSKSEKGRVGEILAAVDGKSILTVGETEAFARQGGIINLITVGNKVQYEINLEAARRAHLDISSKLLSLAKIVGSDRDN